MTKGKRTENKAQVISFINRDKILTRMQTFDNCGGIDQIATAQIACDLGAERFQRNLGRLVRRNIGDFLRLHADRNGRHRDGLQKQKGGIMLKI